MLIEVDIDALISKLEYKIKELELKKEAVFNYQFHNYGFKKGNKKPGLFNRSVFLEDETKSDFIARFWFSREFDIQKTLIKTMDNLIRIYRNDLVFLNSLKNQFDQKTVLVEREGLEKLL